MTESARDEALRLAREAGFIHEPARHWAYCADADALARLIALARSRPGWKWVPEQWTTKMAHKGYLAAEKAKAEGRYIACAECGEIYNAMLAAVEEPK